LSGMPGGPTNEIMGLGDLWREVKGLESLGVSHSPSGDRDAVAKKRAEPEGPAPKRLPKAIPLLDHQFDLTGRVDDVFALIARNG
jgi:hypothetical protein